MSLWGTSAQPKVPRTSYSSYTYVCSELQQQLKNSLFQGGVEKTNKSELRNRLTYRVLIYIFEVRIKTFFLKWEISRSKSQFEIFFFKKTAFFFFWGWRPNFFWAHVISKDICNKFIASKFSVGCMVWSWC